MCVFFFLVHFVDLFQSTQKLQNFEQRKTIKTMNKNNKLFDTSHYIIGPGTAVEDVSRALLVQGFPEIDGAVLGTPSHGASRTSTQLGAAHTRARQSCSQHSSGRLSDVCMRVWGGGGEERMAVMQSTLHWEDGRCV